MARGGVLGANAVFYFTSANLLSGFFLYAIRAGFGPLGAQFFDLRQEKDVQKTGWTGAERGMAWTG
jgi:hypothetical protein